MATPILNTVSKDLAYKLQDPVASGTTKGLRLSAAERFRYVLRSYRRLLRIVTMLYPGLIQKLFQNYYTSTTGTSDISGVVSTITLPAEFLSVYCKRPTDEDYSKAEFVSPRDYLDVKTGQNAFYSPSINTSQYYWTRRNDDVQLLPQVQLAWEILWRQDRAAAMESSGQGGDYDLDVPTEHLDLLLSFACAEAYMDIGQYDAASAYKQDAQEQLAILAGEAQKREVKDTDEES